MATQLFPDPRPRVGDTVPVLYKKWNQILSAQRGDAHKPKPFDWKANSLVKIAALLAGV